jgi:hypothetical protein
MHDISTEGIVHALCIFYSFLPTVPTILQQQGRDVLDFLA